MAMLALHRASIAMLNRYEVRVAESAKRYRYAKGGVDPFESTSLVSLFLVKIHCSLYI
jgi:hypothetical protein